ncbi:unnamed protein product [Ranitomeya imitator]|uniref:SET domain-containing protein n=1 Tax=Ranitomeya imitator TaxID=111125 RepID=A0ABN9M9J4_9NEOB|nr:unnamed protein product [Ranitomeya imitator]
MATETSTSRKLQVSARRRSVPAVGGAMEARDVCGGQEALPVPVCGGQEALLPSFQSWLPVPAQSWTRVKSPSRAVSVRSRTARRGSAPASLMARITATRRLLSAQKPVLECNVLCRCGDSCANRETQRGLQYQLHVRPVPGKGWGLCTQESVPSGRFVCEYAGEVLGPEEARRRIKEHLHSGHVLETFVDPTYVGNIGRFLNHSCQPNLVMVPVRTHSMVPRLALFAARDIQAGEELCYDYSGMAFNFTPDSERQSGHRTAQKAEANARSVCAALPPARVLSYSGTVPAEEDVGLILSSSPAAQ